MKINQQKTYFSDYDSNEWSSGSGINKKGKCKKLKILTKQ